MIELRGLTFAFDFTQHKLSVFVRKTEQWVCANFSLRFLMKRQTQSQGVELGLVTACVGRMHDELGDEKAIEPQI
jgi:hypothetical protein